MGKLRRAEMLKRGRELEEVGNGWRREYMRA